MKPEYVTETAERKPVHSSRRVRVYNVYPGEVHYNPWDDFPELRDLSVHGSKKEKAKALSLKFYELGPNPKREVALPIVEELIGVCQKPRSALSHLERWNITAEHLPGDIGGPNRERFVEIITQRCRGNVLEAMAGFNSYVVDSPGISGVTASDYSREMLLRYPFPERKRVVFDLNRISSEGVGLDFFGDGEFDTITCCYGVNYLEETIPVFQEFRRTLSPGGIFLVLGNPAAGYPDVQERWFDPDLTAQEMEAVGFSSSIESFPELTGREIRDYYLVSGVKGKK